MKKIFFTLNLIMLINFGNAQSYIIEYEERANIENQLKNVTDPEIRKRVTAYLSKPRTFYLYYYNGTSLYIQEQNKSQENDNGLSMNGNKAKTVDIGRDGGGIYKNFKTKKYLQEADVLGKKLLVDDVLEKYNWQLMNEEKMIGNFKCQKAITKINNEDITAWYTDVIPIQDGPKDYYGLPGLIIELTAEKKTYHAIKISKTENNIKIQVPKNGKKVNKKEYHKILKEKISELKRGMGNSLRN